MTDADRAHIAALESQFQGLRFASSSLAEMAGNAAMGEFGENDRSRALDAKSLAYSRAADSLQSVIDRLKTDLALSKVTKS